MCLGGYLRELGVTGEAFCQNRLSMLYSCIIVWFVFVCWPSLSIPRPVLLELYQLCPSELDTSTRLTPF